MKKENEIPALTKSGGLLSNFGGHEAVLEYRIWVHFRDGRDDEYYVSNSLAGLFELYANNHLKSLFELQAKLKGDKEITYVEQPLAVVWDDKYKDYREVCIDGIDYK